MKGYSIFELKDSEYNFLIIANTHENPVNALLCEEKIAFIENGDIIFDLALINGLKKNRFVKVTVQSHKMLPNTIEVVTEVCPKAKEISKNYFNKNADIVRQSILPKATKYFLSKSSL